MNWTLLRNKLICFAEDHPFVCTLGGFILGIIVGHVPGAE